jgi:hypothetical protein
MEGHSYPLPEARIGDTDGPKDQSFCWAPVAHTCEPSYSGGRDQEGCSSKPAWANSSRDPISKKKKQKKKLHTKRAGGTVQCRP